MSCFEYLFEKLLYQYDFANKQTVSESPPVGLKEMVLKLADGTQVVGWYQQENKDWPILIYFHGNGLNIQGVYASGGFQQFAELKTLGLTFDYPKYGLSTGRPNEETIMTASRAVIDFVQSQFPNKPIVIWGRSLGCAPATQIAEQYQGIVKGLILTSPWSSAWKLVQKATGFSEKSSKKNVRGNAWQTEAFASKIHIPVLIHHGVQDQTVAFSLGEELYKQFPPGVATFIPVQDKDHNNVISDQQLEEISAFIKSL